MKISIGKLVLVFVGIPLAYAGYLEYGKYETKQRIATELTQSSVRCSNRFRDDIKPASGSTRAEMLARLQTDIEAIEEQRLMLQSEIKGGPMLTAALAQMGGCQALLRKLGTKTRGEVALLVAVQAQQVAFTQLVAATLTPFFDVAKRAQDRSMDSVKDAEANYERTYIEIRLAIDDLHAARIAAAEIFPTTALIELQLLQALAATHRAPKLSLSYGKQP